MKASVIVGAHNEGERLWRTIESILETRDDLHAEVIVADDASTDNSVDEVRKRFPQVVIVEHEKRMGVAATRASAVKRALGNILIFLDGHTKPEPGALKRLTSDVSKTEGKAIIIPQIVGLDEGTWQSQTEHVGNGFAVDLETFECWWLPSQKLREVRVGNRSFYESPAFAGCALAVSRELYQRLWGFDGHMQQWGFEDIDLALKAWTMGFRVLNDPGATVAHRFQKAFTDYEVSPEYPLANKIRTARKHFTSSVWEEWLVRAQEQERRRLKRHPEGLWARAWEIFQRDRKSAEHERTYLLSRRERDEFWYAARFERSWPVLGGANFPTHSDLPKTILFATQDPTPHITSISPNEGVLGTNVPITIEGYYFQSGAHITPPDGVSVSGTDVTGSNYIYAEFHIPGDLQPGVEGVTVTNPDNKRSNTTSFTLKQTP